MDGEWIARGDSAGFQSDAVRPPPPVAPTTTRPGGNQMNDNMSHFYHPFGRQEKHPTNIVFAQDSTFLTKINLVHSEPCNPEANHLFLSGSSNHSQRRSLQQTNPMYELPVTDPLASDFSVTVRSLISGPSSSAYPRAVDHADYNGCRMEIESNDPFTVYGQQSQCNYNQSFVQPESIDTPRSLFSPLNICNQGSYKTFHGNVTVAGVPSTLNLHNTGSTHATVNPPSHCNAQITSNNASEKKFTNSDQVSGYKLGAPRVFCMGTVGEIFLNERGFFGVICLCHSLHMSVAKFCEHSGSPFVNPGDAVCLDNGQTIAQWRKLFFWNAGMRIADDNIGWDWPDCIVSPCDLIGSKFNNCKFPKFHESSHPLKLSGESVGHGDILKNNTSLAQPNMGHPAFEKLLTRPSDNVLQKNAMLKENFIYKGPSGSLLKSSDH